MGLPVVHFEIIGQDGEALRRYYSELFGWEIDVDNPMHYGMVAREANLSPEGIGIGGGSAGSEGIPAGRRASAARGSWARRRSWTQSRSASSPTPRAT